MMIIAPLTPTSNVALQPKMEKRPNRIQYPDTDFLIIRFIGILYYVAYTTRLPYSEFLFQHWNSCQCRTGPRVFLLLNIFISTIHTHFTSDNHMIICVWECACVCGELIQWNRLFGITVLPIFVLLLVSMHWEMVVGDIVCSWCRIKNPFRFWLMVAWPKITKKKGWEFVENL